MELAASLTSTLLAVLVLYSVAKLTMTALRRSEASSGPATHGSEASEVDQPEQARPQGLASETLLFDAILAADHTAQRIFFSTLAAQSPADARSFRLSCRAARDLADSLLTSPVIIWAGGVVGGGQDQGVAEAAKAAWAAAGGEVVEALRATARRWPHRTELHLHLKGMQQVKGVVPA